MCQSLPRAALQLLAQLNPADTSGSFSLSSWQKYAHVRQAQRGSKPYYTSVMWWCGVVLMGVGELGNFAAYGFAPASLIAPLGCVSVIGECDLFSLIHCQWVRQKERLHPLGTIGVNVMGKLLFFMLITSSIGLFIPSTYITKCAGFTFACDTRKYIYIFIRIE